MYKGRTRERLRVRTRGTPQAGLGRRVVLSEPLCWSSTHAPLAAGRSAIPVNRHTINIEIASKLAAVLASIETIL